MSDTTIAHQQFTTPRTQSGLSKYLKALQRLIDSDQAYVGEFVVTIAQAEKDDATS